MSELVRLTVTDSSGRRVKGKCELLKLPLAVLHRPHNAFELRVNDINMVSHDMANEGVTYDYTSDEGDSTFVVSAESVLTFVVE